MKKMQNIKKKKKKKVLELKQQKFLWNLQKKNY